MTAPDEDFTALLRRLQREGNGALDRVLPLLYDELRGLAESCLRKEHAAQTLQPTALVHEAYLRLAGQRAEFASRLQFLGVAAMMMRRVLVDRARGKGRAKRQARGERVQLTESAAAAPEVEVDLVDLDGALAKLQERDPRKVRIVELRWFAGLTIDETARVLSVSPATVNRDWEVARLWLLRELEGGRHGD